MAYDPEARETGNSAMIISIVALVLIVGGALAYWATRDRNDVAPVASTTIIDRQPAGPTPGTVVVTPPATGPDTIVVERPVVAPQTRTIERDTRTETTRVISAPRSGGNSGSTSAAPNVTVNTNVAPPANTSGGNNEGTASGGNSGGAASGGESSGGATGDGGGTGGSSELPPPSQ
jgi:uncharacterized membrane protein YgcG